MNKYDFENGFNIRFFIVMASIVLLVCYGLFNARNLLLGPSIEIMSPIPESETTENIMTVKGKVKNMTYLSLNQRAISVDKEGLFEEKLILSPGFNTIEIKATDRFKKEAVKTISIYYKQSTTTIESADGNELDTEKIIE